jgi:hypothetical protein
MTLKEFIDYVKCCSDHRIISILKGEAQDVVREIEQLQAQLATIESAYEAQTLTIRKLEKEITALKTPHRCFDCEHYHYTGTCYGQTGVRVEACKVQWLCGHFQKKGTP